MLIERIDILLEARKTRYVHFTDKAGAEAIKKSKRLNKSSFVEGVYAVAEGGKFVAGVADTTLGRATNRQFAVIFTTKQDPQVVYPEEVIWHTDSIRLSSVKIADVIDAQKLLNGRGVVRDSGLLWDTIKSIPWHPSDASNRLWSKGVVDDIRKHIKSKDLIKALQLIREQTGARIRVAKQFVTQFSVSMGI